MELYEHIKPKSIEPRIFNDLYPYSPNDSFLWLEFFLITDSVSRDLAIRLESCIRNIGAWLVLDQTYGFRIQPIIDINSVYGWSSQEEYDLVGKSELMPYSQQLIWSLGELRRRYEVSMLKLKGAG